jgi:putative transposase
MAGLKSSTPTKAARFIGVLKEAGIQVSMDGRGRWLDNVFIERLWRSLKY